MPKTDLSFRNAGINFPNDFDPNNANHLQEWLDSQPINNETWRKYWVDKVNSFRKLLIAQELSNAHERKVVIAAWLLGMGLYDVPSE